MTISGPYKGLIRYKKILHKKIRGFSTMKGRHSLKIEGVKLFRFSDVF